MFTINYDKKKIYNYIIIFFPILLVIGSAAVNIFLVLSSFFIILELLKKNVHLRNIYLIFVSFLIYYAYLIIISFFAENSLIALKSSISQIRFLLFSFFIYLHFDAKKYLNTLILVWSLILLLVSADTILQFLTGMDVFGYKAEGYVKEGRNFLDPKVGRLSGPFGDELVVGAFLAKLSPPIVMYLIMTNKYKNFYNLNIVFIVLVYLSIILSGERTSFIIFTLCLALSFYLKDKIKFLIFFLISTLLIFTIYCFNNYSNKRINETINIAKDISSSSYGRIYESSFEVWKQNLLFGVGLKNYNQNCLKLEDPEPEKFHKFCSPNHSHNFILQILSETGIVGLLLFYGFIFSIFHKFRQKNIKEIKKNNKENYNYFIFGSSYLLLYSITPNIIPSGSFFTSWNGSFFWLQLGFLLNFFNRYEDSNKV